MRPQRRVRRIRPAAPFDWAHERTLARMRSLMPLQGNALGEPPLANIAFEGFDAAVDAVVPGQGPAPLEPAATLVAPIGQGVRVRLRAVLAQVGGGHPVRIVAQIARQAGRCRRCRRRVVP